jgi:hypothetical protein
MAPDDAARRVGARFDMKCTIAGDWRVETRYEVMHRRRAWLMLAAWAVFSRNSRMVAEILDDIFICRTAT